MTVTTVTTVTIVFYQGVTGDALGSAIVIRPSP